MNLGKKLQKKKINKIIKKYIFRKKILYYMIKIKLN